MSSAMMAKVVIVLRSLPGVIPFLRLAEVDVADIDVSASPGRRRRCGGPPLGSSGMLRFSQAGICALIILASVPGRSFT